MQTSLVQTLLSVHDFGAPGVQLPLPLHWSFNVQALPSLQDSDVGLFDHAVFEVVALHHWHWFAGFWFWLLQHVPLIRQYPVAT